MSIHLFLGHLDTHAPVLARGLPPAGAHGAPPPDTRHPAGHLTDRGGLADALPDQRWGLIVPKGKVGERLRARVDKLKQKRAEDQKAEVVVYEVDPDMGPEEANRWIGGAYWDRVKRRAEDLPRYLLILGGPDLVSWDLQQMLGSEAFVGRLAFDDERGEIDDAAYDAYVEKALRWERRDREAPIPLGRAIFYTARDGTEAITEGYEHLMRPTAAITRDLERKGKLPETPIAEIGAGAGPLSIDDLLDGKRALLAEAGGAEAGFLFSMSYGLGLPEAGRWGSPGEQRRLQGAMRITPSNDRITAREIAGRKFLPGGLWLMFACFGAGTPARSAYAPWLERLSGLGLCDRAARDVLAALPREGERPFVAALPQSALANPDGPLGVIGHVDLAWTWSFLSDVATTGGAEARVRYERFQGIVTAALKGQRFGVAHGALAHFVGEVNRSLATMYDEAAKASPNDRARLARRADLWMQRQDLAAHVLLGDPAARLPIAARPHGIPERGEAPGAPPAPRRTPEEMEAAVVAYLRDAAAAEAIASRHGITPAELSSWAETYGEWGRRGLALRK